MKFTIKTLALGVFVAAILVVVGKQDVRIRRLERELETTQATRDMDWKYFLWRLSDVAPPKTTR